MLKNKMKRYVFIPLTLLCIFIVNTFAVNAEDSDLNNTSKVLLLNSIQNLSQDKLADLLKEIVDIPNREVEIEYNGIRRTLTVNEAKQLAIVLLRLNLENKLGAGNNIEIKPFKDFKFGLGNNNPINWIDFKLCIDGSILKIKSYLEEYSIVVEKVKGEDESLKILSNLADGTYFSKEANFLFKNLVEKHFQVKFEKNPEILYSSIFDKISSYTPQELEEIYLFTEYFIKNKVEFWGISREAWIENKKIDFKKVHEISDIDKSIFIASLIRTKLFTDVFVYCTYTKEGDFVCRADPFTYLETMNFIIINNGEVIITCRYLSNKYRNGLSVLLEDYHTSVGDAKKASYMFKLPLFYRGKLFVNQTSFISPELYQTLFYLSNKYK